VSELRSAVGSLRGETLAELPDARVEEDFAEIRRIVDQLELEALRRLAEIERRGSFNRDGHLSAAAWLTSAFKMSWGVARDQVRTARALDERCRLRAPPSRRANSRCAPPRVWLPRATPIPRRSRKRNRNSSMPRASTRSATFGASSRTGDRPSSAIEGEEALRAERRLHASVTMHGMVRVDGTLDPETGETVLTALRAVVDAETRSRPKDDVDDRTPRSVEPTRSARSVVSGSIDPTGPRSAASSRT
jgi:hypothetical protein